MESSLGFSFFLIFSGAAILASIALYTRQPLLIAYVVLGAILGPFGFSWVDNSQLLSDISHIGIMFLLFLLGLDMQPSNLINMARKATYVAVISSICFFAVGYSIAWLFGFPNLEAILIGVAMMFSSTIIGIKLLPTTVLHHRHTGELVVGLLLLQDLIAIFVLLALYNNEPEGWTSYIKPLAMLPLLAFGATIMVRFVLLKLIQRFDRFQEYIFLLTIGWCLGVAEMAHLIGLSAEIGAFIAGITLATSPIAQFIAVSLKPLRDFFLILFFFSVGASLNLSLLPNILLPALLLAAAAVAIKPPVFRLLLGRISETDKLAWEIGFRLGHNSEFALLISYIALANGFIGEKASLLIQFSAILTFLVASYIIILNYPSPIAISDRLRRD